IVTEVPTGTDVPAGGTVRVTSLAGTVADASLSWLPTTRLRATKAPPAELGDWPTSEGICTCCLPVEITSCTADPLPCVDPAAGLVLITFPLATVFELAV